MLSIKTPEEVALELANRLRTCRLDLNWSREELSRRSGVTVASIRRFETTGEIALKRLLILAFVLHKLDDFSDIMTARGAIKTLAELEKKSHTRKRGRGKSS